MMGPLSKVAFKLELLSFHESTLNNREVRFLGTLTVHSPPTYLRTVITIALEVY